MCSSDLIVAVTKLISRKVNNMKKMSSEELNKTLGVLKNLTAKIQNFNSTGRQAKDLIKVRLENRQVQQSVLQTYELIIYS